MNTQENKNEEKIDLSQFPVKKKEPIYQPKRFKFENFEESWRKMGKRNRIFTAIILVSFVMTVIILFSFFSGRNERKTGPASDVFPVEYAPPSEYPLQPGEKYTPPFP